MAYEIDFIGVGSEIKQDADAICLRWKIGKNCYGNPVYHIAVYDGGFAAHGQKMSEHMNQYYFADPKGEKDASEKIVDFMFVSHPDQDHTVGLRTILENFSVQKIIMNRPWLYVDGLWDKINDGRITKNSLKKRLREKYRNIADIEDIAEEKGIPIEEAFQGSLIDNRLLICSPSKQFYLDLLIESEKTPLVEQASDKQHGNAIVKIAKYARESVLSLIESWSNELLRYNVKTTAENETSVVIRGRVDGSEFLLCGDAGIRALTETMDYLDSQGENIQQSVTFYEIPHHGSRRNVSPTILDRMIGCKLKQGETRNRSAIASVAKDSDHPRKMVTNAYLRRGVNPYKTTGNIIRHHEGDMPNRGWNSVDRIEFSNKVEEWDD